MCVCALSCVQLMDCRLPGSSAHGIFPGKSIELGCHSSSRDLPNPGNEPVSLVSHALAERFFTTGATWACKHPYSKYFLGGVTTLVHIRFQTIPLITLILSFLGYKTGCLQAPISYDCFED